MAGQRKPIEQTERLHLRNIRIGKTSESTVVRVFGTGTNRHKCPKIFLQNFGKMS